jgi:ureidoglycolate lyase
MIIKAVPLTAEAFAPFGQLLAGRGEGPERHEFAAEMQNLRPGARPNLTFMRVSVVGPAIPIGALERHPFSNQAFMPLSGTRHLVVVSPSTAEGEPDLRRIEAFEAGGAQAINYNANVWHAPRTAIGAPGELVMFRWDDGSENDTELRALETPFTVELRR